MGKADSGLARPGSARKKSAQDDSRVQYSSRANRFEIEQMHSKNSKKTPKTVIYKDESEKRIDDSNTQRSTRTRARSSTKFFPYLKKTDGGLRKLLQQQRLDMFACVKNH